MASPRGVDLISEEERRQILELYFEFNKVKNTDLEAIEDLFKRLSTVIALLRTRIGAREVKETEDTRWAVIRSFLGEEKKISSEEKKILSKNIIGFDSDEASDYQILSAALGNLGRALSNKNDRSLIETLITAYENFQSTTCTARMRWENTHDVLAFTKCMAELKDKNLDAIAEKMKQMRLSEVLSKLKVAKIPRHLQAALLELDALILGEPNNPLMLLAKFILLPEEERTTLLNNLTRESYTKFRIEREVSVENYLRLSDEEQIDLLSIIYSTPSVQGDLADLRDKIERLQLSRAANELSLPTTLLRTKEKLGICTWILVSVAPRFDKTLETFTVDEYQDLLRYLSLKSHLPLLNALKGIYTSLATSSAFELIPSHLRSYVEFKKIDLSVFKKHEEFFAPYTTLSLEQKTALAEIITECIEKTKATKSFQKAPASFALTVEFINQLALYAKSQKIIIDYNALEKLNDKVKLLPVERSKENLKHLSEKQEKLVEIRTAACFKLISLDLLLPIVENQLAALDEKSLDTCIKELKAKKLEDIATHSELAKLTLDFRAWVIRNNFVFSPAKHSLAMLDAVQGNLMTVRDLLKQDKYKEKFKKFEGVISPKTSASLVLSKIPHIELLIVNLRTAHDLLPKIDPLFEKFKTHATHAISAVPPLTIPAPDSSISSQTNGQASPTKRGRHTRVMPQITSEQLEAARASLKEKMGKMEKPAAEESAPTAPRITSMTSTNPEKEAPKTARQPRVRERSNTGSFFSPDDMPAPSSVPSTTDTPKKPSTEEKRGDYKRGISESQLKFNLLRAKFEGEKQPRNEEAKEEKKDKKPSQ